MAIENIEKTAGQVYNIGGGVDKHYRFGLLDYLENSSEKVERKFTDWRPRSTSLYFRYSKLRLNLDGNLHLHLQMD